MALLLEAGAYIDRYTRYISHIRYIRYNRYNRCTRNTRYSRYMLLAAGASIDPLQPLQPLHAAGASIDPTRKDGSTPLIYSCMKGHATCTRLLIESGANANARRADGATAAHFAVGGWVGGGRRWK